MNREGQILLQQAPNMPCFIEMNDVQLLQEKEMGIEIDTY